MRSTLVAAFLLWPALARGAENAVDFKRDVQPIFQARCTRCHGAEQQRSQLRLDSRTGALRGGMSGAVVLPGDSRGSALFQRITGVLQPSMPFEGSPLPAEEIARIQTWIDAGAPGAVDAEPPDQRHWAYRKPVRPEPPAVANAAWIRNPIDRFVLARLEREGLTPAPEANRETLIRRVSLDLVGLPPTLAEVDAFLADTSPDAYEKVVDRLLASPHYGERWARPWLDLARYADTNGYEKDRRRSAWMYRDWVIDALNQDLSFRDFTIQQIAGDMLPGATTAQKIATGFHRNTLLNQEGGIDVEEARWETLVDRVNTTAFTWLGSTVACAQCHNHKFDPISQKDYYRMMAFFDNAEYRVQGLGEVVTDKWIVEPDLELAPPEVVLSVSLPPTRPRSRRRRTALSWSRDRNRSGIPTPSPCGPPGPRSRPSASRRFPIHRCPRAAPAVRPPVTSCSRVWACARDRRRFHSCAPWPISPKMAGASPRPSTRARIRAGASTASKAAPTPRSSCRGSRSVRAEAR